MIVAEDSSGAMHCMPICTRTVQPVAYYVTFVVFHPSMLPVSRLICCSILASLFHALILVVPSLQIARLISTTILQLTQRHEFTSVRSVDTRLLMLGTCIDTCVFMLRHQTFLLAYRYRNFSAVFELPAQISYVITYSGSII